MLSRICAEKGFEELPKFGGNGIKAKPGARAAQESRIVGLVDSAG
jgi:hypothetical protein